MTRPDSSDLRIRDETQKSPSPASAERGACVTFDCKNRRTSHETSFSRENRKEREVESHTRKSLTVKCCARFRHNTYFFVGIVRPGRRDYGPSQRPAPPPPGKTDTGLTAGAGGPTMRRSARLQPPRHHGPSHGLTSRPLRGRSSRTRSRASSHPARGDAPPAGRPASGSYPRTAGPGNGAAHRCAAIPDFLLDRSAKAS